MDNVKKQKVLRIVGLVVVTILVVVGIFLTIYFVQKSENEKKANQIEYIQSEINKVVEQDGFNFIVKDMKILSQDEDEGTINIQLTIEIEAKEDMSISYTDFSIENSTYLSQNGLKDTISKGESLTFELNWVVKSSNKLLYLIYKNIKIALGQVQI